MSRTTSIKAINKSSSHSNTLKINKKPNDKSKYLTPSPIPIKYNDTSTLSAVVSNVYNDEQISSSDYQFSSGNKPPSQIESCYMPKVCKMMNRNLQNKINNTYNAVNKYNSIRHKRNKTIKNSTQLKEYRNNEIIEKPAKLYSEYYENLDKKKYLKRKSKSFSIPEQSKEIACYINSSKLKNSHRKIECNMNPTLDLYNDKLGKIYESTLEFEKLEAQCNLEEKKNVDKEDYKNNTEMKLDLLQKIPLHEFSDKSSLEQTKENDLMKRIKEFENEDWKQIEIERLQKEISLKNQECKELCDKVKELSKKNKELMNTIDFLLSQKKSIELLHKNKLDSLELHNECIQSQYMYNKPMPKLVAEDDVIDECNESDCDTIKLYNSESNREEIIIDYKILSIDTLEDGKRLRTYSNGIKETIFPNGIREQIYPDNCKLIYFTNMDIKQIDPKGITINYFTKNKIINTTLPNGLTIVKHPTDNIK